MDQMGQHFDERAFARSERPPQGFVAEPGAQSRQPLRRIGQQGQKSRDVVRCLFGRNGLFHDSLPDEQPAPGRRGERVGLRCP